MSDPKVEQTEEVNEKVAQAVQERYLESFVKAAATYGVTASSEEDLEELLKIAATLRDIQEKQEPVIKQASSGFIKEASEALQALVAQIEL